MVEVHLWAGLRAFTGGQLVVEVEARTVGEMLAALIRAHPGLKEIIEDGVSVAIDGQIIHSSESTPIPEGAEIYLMQRVKGG